MKLFDKIKTTLLSLRKSVERFPLTVLISAILVVLLIVFNETVADMSQDSIEKFSKINMIVGMGILLSACIGLLKERFFDGNRLKEVGAYLAGAAVLVLYYLYLLPEFNMIPMIRFAAVQIFLIVFFFFIPWLKRKENYEIYVIRVFNAFFTTWIYSAVLYGGISAILFTTDTLFELKMDSKYYSYSFFIVAFIFAISLFLSKIPGKEPDFKDYKYSKSLKVLLLYIVIPLITIYTMILYAYFAKILFTWVWPKGLVSNLVLWYSALSVGVIFLITPVLEENQVSKLFKVWFPKLILPLLGMMFVSIGLRINQYGITENRYYVVLLGIWVTCIMIYFSLVKPLKNIIIPMTLSVVILISVFGPVSGFSLSMMSQNNRFDAILENNQMLDGGQILKNSAISATDRKELSNIISYFESRYALDDLKTLPKDFKTSDMEDVFGFKYAPQYGFQENQYFYYNLDITQKPFNIAGYEYYFVMTTWNTPPKTIDGISVQFDPKNSMLTISDKAAPLLTQDTMAYIKEVHAKNYANALGGKGDMVSLDGMTFQGENENVSYRIIFTAINGQLDSNSDISVENTEFILLLHVKE
ncbi:MAG: DUF4153 domain-containing protein [Eubacteriaceae bacterium]|nr:DUF4153 domain-containing protein [Eubacteriaceae bacterium]